MLKKFLSRTEGSDKCKPGLLNDWSRVTAYLGVSKIVFTGCLVALCSAEKENKEKVSDLELNIRYEKGSPYYPEHNWEGARARRL